MTRRYTERIKRKAVLARAKAGTGSLSERDKRDWQDEDLRIAEVRALALRLPEQPIKEFWLEIADLTSHHHQRI